jgi:hypothetical protein
MIESFDRYCATLMRFFGRLARCRRAATISEYGIVALLVVGAAGAAHSPRLHTARGDRPQAVHTRSAAENPKLALHKRQPAPRERGQFQR